MLLSLPRQITSTQRLNSISVYLCLFYFYCNNSTVYSGTSMLNPRGNNDSTTKHKLDDTATDSFARSSFRCRCCCCCRFNLLSTRRRRQFRFLHSSTLLHSNGLGLAPISTPSPALSFSKLTAESRMLPLSLVLDLEATTTMDKLAHVDLLLAS